MASPMVVAMARRSRRGGGGRIEGSTGGAAYLVELIGFTRRLIPWLIRRGAFKEEWKSCGGHWLAVGHGNGKQDRRRAF